MAIERIDVYKNLDSGETKVYPKTVADAVYIDETEEQNIKEYVDDVIYNNNGVLSQKGTSDEVIIDRLKFSPSVTPDRDTQAASIHYDISDNDFEFKKPNSTSKAPLDIGEPVELSHAATKEYVDNKTAFSTRITSNESWKKLLISHSNSSNSYVGLYFLRVGMEAYAINLGGSNQCNIFHILGTNDATISSATSGNTVTYTVTFNYQVISGNVYILYCLNMNSNIFVLKGSAT